MFSESVRTISNAGATVVGQQIEGAAIRPGDALGGEDDFLSSSEVVLAG